jgi:hypothetical protein
MHLKTLGGNPNRLLKQPPIQLQLEADFGVVILIDLPGELRVTDQVAIVIKDQEIWATDNRDGNSPEICFASKFALINDGDTIPDRTRRPVNPLVW